MDRGFPLYPECGKRGVEERGVMRRKTGNLELSSNKKGKGGVA